MAGRGQTCGAEGVTEVTPRVDLRRRGSGRRAGARTTTTAPLEPGRQSPARSFQPYAAQQVLAPADYCPQGSRARWAGVRARGGAQTPVRLGAAGEPRKNPHTNSWLRAYSSSRLGRPAVSAVLDSARAARQRLKRGRKNFPGWVEKVQVACEFTCRGAVAKW